MKLAFYQGKSWISKIIRWKTRGKYSHVAIMFDNGDILEAWQGTNSVRWIQSLSDGHSKGTPVDIYTIKGSVNELAAYVFAKQHVGDHYGWRTIAQFFTHSAGDNPSRWICSEIALAAVLKSGVALLSRVAAHKVSPVMLSWSPLLKHDSTVVTK